LWLWEIFHHFGKEFKNYLKYKNKEIEVEYLTLRLKVEEENKSSKKIDYSSGIVPVVTHFFGSHINKKNQKRERENTKKSKNVRRK
jgi:hypothetical protein